MGVIPRGPIKLMMRMLTAVVMLSCLDISTSVGQSNVLTFQEAVKIGLQNNVTLNQQKNYLELNQAQKLSSIASIGPSVSASGQVAQFNGNSFNANAGKVINGVRDNVTGSISANLNLFSGFSTLNTIRQYSNLLDAQSYFVNRTTQDVINLISTQYLQVMLDVELLKIAQENHNSLEKQLQLVKEQVNVGSLSPVDEYNQDALTKAGELKKVQAEIALNNDKATLTQTLLIDPFEQFDVEKPTWDVNFVSNQDELNVVELSERAKQYRGDYLSAVKNEAAQKYGMRASLGYMMPSLYAFGNYGSAYNFQHNVPDSITNGSGVRIANPDSPRPFSEQFRTNNVYKSYGLSLSVPLFRGLQSRTSYIRQKTLYRNNQLVTKNLEYQIKNDVQRTIRNYEGAKKAYSVSLDQLKAAEMAFELENERYNLGITNFVSYTNANRVLVQAQTDKAQAEYRLVFQKILLEYALGTLKIEDLQ